MKKHLTGTLAAVAAVLFTFPTDIAAQAPWDGSVDMEWAGDGSKESPYLITSAAELAGLAKRTNADETFEGKFFRLTADLRLSDASAPADKRLNWTPIGEFSLNNDDPEDNPGGFYSNEHWFKGTFDGAGHTIHDLWYTGTTDFDDWNDPFGSGQLDFTAWNKALFGLLDGANIHDLRLENANIAGTALIGGVCVRAKNSTFTKVHVSGDMKSGSLENGGSAAALAVEATDCTFSACSADARVFGRSNTGVLVGLLQGASTVTDCTTAGTVSGAVHVGGMIGAATPLETAKDGPRPAISGCVSSAEVNVLNERVQGNLGAGFIGLANADIARCGATGAVKSNGTGAAGFCHTNYGTIDSSYATGDVTDTDYGVFLSSFVIYNGLDTPDDEYTGVIRNCFGAGKVSAPAPPADVVSMGTHICAFVSGNFNSTGSYIANCFYNSTATTPNEPLLGGVSAASAERLQSEDFVAEFNAVAAIMGISLWKHNTASWPTPENLPATDVSYLFAGGTGSASQPFLITTKTHLGNIALVANRGWSFAGQFLRQTADIALNAPQDQWGEQMPDLWTPIAQACKEGDSEWTNYFRGNYDGDFHTVANLYIDKNAFRYSGLFGVLGEGAVIRNLGVTDAWVEGDEYAGILLGALNEQNDHTDGVRYITNCWTSGMVTASVGSGAIAGQAWNGAETYLEGCYSTAEASKAFISSFPTATTYIYGCFYGGKASGYPVMAYTPNLFMSYVDSTKNPGITSDSSLSAFGRTTAYMKSAQFVNDLNYARAAKDFGAEWGRNEGAYPSFSGAKPTLTVTFEPGDELPAVSFRAYEGSSLSEPPAPVREGYRLMGWYSDPEFTQVFDFGTTLLTADTQLYARWSKDIVPDYTIFRNKFAKTFTISTVEQLYAFSDIVNGHAADIELGDFAGKTVKLGADLTLNDPSDADAWGTSVTPSVFPVIASASSHPFRGIFDGQSHSITGLYTETAGDTGFTGLFGYVEEEAVVKDLILEKAVAKKTAPGSTALLAYMMKGTMSRCGVEGRIDSRFVANSVYPGSSAPLAVETGEKSSVSECYAIVDIDSYNDNCTGLIGSQKGTLANSFARGSVSFARFGDYAGLVGYCYRPFTDCYAAVALSYDVVPTISVNVGGTFFNMVNSDEKPGYYDRELVADTFDKVNFSAEAFARGTGLSTLDMHKMASYSGWNFTDTWGRRNDRNEGYPYLRWTAPGLENDRDDTVGIESVTPEAPAEVEIFTLTGIRVYTGPDGAQSLPAGLYLKRQNNSTIKILLH